MILLKRKWRRRVNLWEKRREKKKKEGRVRWKAGSFSIKINNVSGVRYRALLLPGQVAWRIRSLPMVWFRVTGRYWTGHPYKYKTWYLATCFLCISLGPRLSGYPNTNSIRCSSSTGCSEIGRRILESAPRLQRVVAPFKHEYQKEYSISKVAANYWDYTHDWNCGILVFPKGWEFRISLLFRLKCW